MRNVHQLALLALSSYAVAAPLVSAPWKVGKRQVESQMNDIDILRYALTLEHLEDKFYREGLANFTQGDFAQAGFDSTFYQNVQAISAHETAHVQFLTAALKAAGYAPTVECTYAFGISTVEQFVATASILEGVGQAAYLGAAPQVSSKTILGAAGSILTIEARHDAYLRAALSQSPFPQANDDALTPDEVHTMAHGFIVSCPAGNPSFGVKAFPGLAVTTTGKITSGMTIALSTAGFALAPADSKAHLYAAFITALGPDFAPLTPSGDGENFQVTVPIGVNGQSYLLLTNCNDTVSDSSVVAGPTFLEITNNPLNTTLSGKKA
ncbi:hypothetical protein LTR78_008618 [Recurvomyces mirabilis]|uniref:Stress response protein rds1p n=1 Tax=Recurvomyces mirabilis TaxID=574656 RepID=A0AAE0WIX5_9PEZI|nr:hypothetical protein LTR78_008618 [Recurvomyces mirabilis]KAK5153470.1 hypothetical protein LTS14_007641 [Recurvomyces mirabilis]